MVRYGNVGLTGAFEDCLVVDDADTVSALLISVFHV
jgi:hypothetical protein